MRSKIRIVIGAGALCLMILAPAARAATSLAAEATPVASGGGEYVFGNTPCLTDEHRQQIWFMLEANKRKLELEGKLPPAAIEAHPLLAWPLRLRAGLTDPGYHGISGFVDQNPAFPNQLSDYNCGARTYDTSAGYNHGGIDYFNWPFTWLKMDNSDVEIVAAAPGTLYGKDDGFFDRSCGPNSNQWNAAYIQHADGSYAWYGHMKNGSVTTRPIGSAIAQGEYLGVVGSSGNSTGPHLHFEMYDSFGIRNEPYDGPCNTMNPGDSWWASQRPYYDSAVNHLGTNSSPPNFNTCPAAETTNETGSFVTGSTAYFVAYYRDQRVGQVSQYTIYRPDSSVYTSWTHSSGSNFNASYWWFDFPNFAPSGPTGTWLFEVVYEGQTYSRPFSVSLLGASGRVSDLRVGKGAGSNITLTWAPSCMASDSNYAVYEGVVGTYYSHVRRTCSTLGQPTANVLPAQDNAYYLVVPLNNLREGSYGTNSASVQRPIGVNPCKTQALGSCP